MSLSRKLRKKRALEDLAVDDEKPANDDKPVRRRLLAATDPFKRRVADVDALKPSATLRVRETALFRPLRAVGTVTDGLPVSHLSLGGKDWVTASIGRSFQVFDCENLRLSYVGPRLNEKIRALANVGTVDLTALKSDIVAWHKMVELGRFRGHTATATNLCTIGSTYLVSSSSAEVLVWPLKSLGVDERSTATKQSDIIIAPLTKLAISSAFGECTALCHPPTYLHKVLLASDQGCLELWNLRSGERVHSFEALKSDAKQGMAITCLREAPHVLDMVAVGYANGRITLLNAREDRVIVEFEQAQGRITALAFRTGSSAPANLVSCAPDGSFVTWDLEKRRAHHTLEGAHNAAITSAKFLPDQPVLLTNGRDNSIRMWIYDTADGFPRLLRSRCGCPGPVRRMSFYNKTSDTNLLVGGGLDGMGFLSRIAIFQSHRNREFSQNQVRKLKKVSMESTSLIKGRLPPIVDMSFCEARHFDWPSVVTAHEGSNVAFVWSMHHAALAPCVLKPPDDSVVSAVSVSKCGNYCVIGLENGALHRFNLQSQLYRGALPKAPEDKVHPDLEKMKTLTVAGPIQRAHFGRVSGLEITISAQVVSIGSHPTDCKLKLWNLMTHEAITKIPLNSGRSGTPSCLMLRAQGSFIAVSLDDGNVVVVDLNGQCVVRSFECNVPAVDVAFSADGRWLGAVLRDGGLRIFDLPAARCIDSFAFARPALSLCFAPSGAFLLTSHAKGNAIQTWANKFLFDPSQSVPLLQSEPGAPIKIDEPGGLEADTDDEQGENDERASKNVHATPIDAKPLEPRLFTLSDVPPQKWLATLHLDLVKERNKPKEAPKPLPSAPFFLPTAHDGVTPRFAAPQAEESGDEKLAAKDENLSRVLSGDRSVSVTGSAFQALLRKEDYDGALTFLKSQTASGVHLAIEELGPFASGEEGELASGLRFFLHHLSQAHFADEVQVFLSIFLQVHGDELAELPELRTLCGQLAKVQEGLWTTLNGQCQKARCFLGMLTQTQSQW